MSRDGGQGPFRLDSIHVKRFKALGDIDLGFDERPISILIGPNGAGKTSVLQALGFARYFIEGRPSQFFEHHGWEPATLVSHVVDKRSQSFYVNAFITNKDTTVLWAFLWSTYHNKNIFETISYVSNKTHKYMRAASYNDGSIYFHENKKKISGFSPEGSILSFIRTNDLPDEEARLALDSVRSWAEGIVSLELLSPTAIRDSMARGKVTDIGVRGERLGAFIAALPADAKQNIVNRLTRFYPSLADLTTTAKRAGWIDLKIAESFGERRLSVGPGHVSDGFLRLLSLAAIPEFPKTTSLVLLDEAENGIDPLILPGFLEMIAQESPAQIIATTHSPILVNRFPPEAVTFLCRAEEGGTIGARFSDIPQFADEFEYRGPGEIWSHSSMDTITGFVREIDRERRKRAAEEEEQRKTARKGTS